MEDLLRLITSNPILLFLIIGAILRFFQSGKEQEAKKEPRKQRTPMGNETQPEVDWREIFRQEDKPVNKPMTQNRETYTYQEEQPQDSLEGSNQRNELLERLEVAKRNKKAAEETLGEKLKDSPIFKEDITGQEKVELDFSKVSRDEAIKGVIWSEILGKPRAKGTYRPSMNTKRRQG